MWLIKASLRNAYMVATLVFVMLVLGLLSMFNIPRDILPVFHTPAVEVLTYYQGMPASSVEKTITNRIERWTSQAPGAQTLESKSVPGVSVVKIYFRDDVDPNGALTLTNSLALGTLPTLPPNTLPPVVLPFDPTGTMPLGILIVKNDQLNEADIKDLGRIDVRNMLGGVRGAVAPVVIGGKDRTILVYLDPRRMQDKKVSPQDVVAALKEGNMMVTPGTAYFGDNQVLLDSNALVEKVKDLNDLPIRIEPGNNVYLRDIGQAEDAYSIQTSRVRINGKRQVYVPVYRQGGASTLDVVDGIKEHIPGMEAQLLNRADGKTELEFIMDQSVYVRKAITSLIHEGIIGAVLVSLMILFFLGNWRMTVIASLSIPFAVLGAITCLYVTGNTINAMTLGGLALAVGPLVDDAIVELENNHRNYHMGKSRIRAALDGCAEVMVPVMVATCTTIIVLSPLALMPGMAGFLFRPLALAVAFAMLSSFLLSRTFVPMMCAKFLPDENLGKKHTGAPSHSNPLHGNGLGLAHPPVGFFGRLHQNIDRFLINQTNNYSKMLARALRHRYKVLVGIALLFLSSLFLFPLIGREFFPQVDAGQITIYMRAPSNLRLDASEKRVAEVEKVIEQLIPARDRTDIVSELGLNPDWSAAYTENSGQQDTVIRVQLSEERQESAQEYAKRLRHAFADNPRFADLSFRFNTGGMISTALNFGVASPINIRVEGGKADEAYKMARRIQREVAQVKGAADVQIAQRLDAPYLIIKVDRQKAANVGLSTGDVIQQVVAAMNSSISIDRNFWIDTRSGNQYFVAVQYPEDPHATLETLKNVFAIAKGNKTPVALSSLVEDITLSTGPVEISHTNLYRTYNVLVNTEDRDVGHVASDVQDRLKKIDKPQGVEVVLSGEYQRMNDAFKQLGYGMILAVVLVYLLQVALFRSWVGPFIIMFTVPLGLMGVLLMLYLTNTTLNVQSLMGVIFLTGIEVNTGVLMVEFANKQRKLGASVHEAITTAASIRFRPIMMTFLAAFFDLLPMAIGIERGSEATTSLARAVVGGLLVSTMLGRFLLPVLYTLLMKERDAREIEMEKNVEAELEDRPETRVVVEETGATAARIVGLPEGREAIGPTLPDRHIQDPP
jgi:multidrug efflux pump subunit AcrB